MCGGFGHAATLYFICNRDDWPSSGAEVVAFRDWFFSTHSAVCINVYKSPVFARASA